MSDPEVQLIADYARIKYRRCGALRQLRVGRRWWSVWWTPDDFRLHSWRQSDGSQEGQGGDASAFVAPASPGSQDDGQES